MEYKLGHIQYSLSSPPGTIVCLCISFVCLSILPNIFNTHTPTLEHTKLLRLHPDNNRVQDRQKLIIIIGALEGAYTNIIENGMLGMDSHRREGKIKRGAFIEVLRKQKCDSMQKYH